MEIEPVPLVQLPDLRSLNPQQLHPQALKRPLSRGAEVSESKRQFRGQGVSYDDIINEAIESFGLTIFGCVDKKITTTSFEFHYRGKDRNGQPGPITLVFSTEQRPRQPQRTPAFLLTFRIKDVHGALDLWQRMYKANNPAIVTIECGLQMLDIKEIIRSVIGGWLDFASLHFY